MNHLLWIRYVSVNSVMISSETNTTSFLLVRFAEHFWLHLREGKMADTSVFTVEESLVAVAWVNEQPYSTRRASSRETA